MKSIEIVEKRNKHTMNVITEKYIHPQPNTYTFAKSLGEHVVYDLCDGKIPVVVYRPSIGEYYVVLVIRITSFVVVHTAQEPMPGWIDNFNGPIGLMVGSGKGIIRTIYCDGNTITDCVPVDMTVKAMIISSWKQATFK